MNLGRDILKELFNPAQENVELSDDFILAYSNKVLDWETLAYKVFKLEKGMVEDIKHRANSRSTLLCQRLLNSMMAFELITFGKLRQMLDGFSVFGGRDIIVSERERGGREREGEERERCKERGERRGEVKGMAVQLGMCAWGVSIILLLLLLLV